MIDFITCNPPSTGGYKYIILAIDHFTKWVEAMPTLNCKDDTKALFFLNHIITHFCVPFKLVLKNGSHFKDNIWIDLSTMLKSQH